MEVVRDYFSSLSSSNVTLLAGLAVVGTLLYFLRRYGLELLYFSYAYM